MAGQLLPVTHIHDKLDEAVSADRKDALIFSVLTVILTPIFILGAIFILLAGIAYSDLPLVDHLGYRDSFAYGVTCSMVFLFMAFFIRPKAQWRVKASDIFWVGSAIVALGVMCLLTFTTNLAQESPGFYWTVFGILALTMLGLLGHAYVPHDDYYTGWYGGMWDNPFTLEDDIDRAHMSLGFATAIPRMLMGSYGEIFGSLWVWKGLTGFELQRASEVLHALGCHDSKRAQSMLQGTDKKTGAHIARALSKLKLVRPGRDGLSLTSDGEKLVGINAWL